MTLGPFWSEHASFSFSLIDSLLHDLDVSLDAAFAAILRCACVLITALFSVRPTSEPSLAVWLSSAFQRLYGKLGAAPRTSPTPKWTGHVLIGLGALARRLAPIAREGMGSVLDFWLLHLPRRGSFIETANYLQSMVEVSSEDKGSE